MSDYSTNSTINLSVNGTNVEEKLKKYEQRLKELRATAQKAAEIGDKGTLQKTNKEIKAVENQMRKVRTATANVEETLKNLDKASPKNLRKDLQTLKAQLNGIERGSDAWNAHIEKIKAVQSELKKVNSELKESEGFWDSFNRKMNDWQTTLAAGAAAVTGVIMAGRSAVNAFAEMDGEMANVRKFTGMTADEVEHLNEEFKNMDTRTSREELNQLAEEAGRLGKSTEEDVLGFVRAADKINVALDDLGDGATLTLSKLTNIFGDEKRLGTEEALLSVGSVINELSQNCTASAPYLAEFAQRLAGVGAQAGMTIPQIMAFGAVLDSQGQAVEMSATALSKLIMDLFKDPAKIAKATGISLDELNAKLKQGTNEGLMLLLDKLHELGNMDVLAPVFADMGENGARASAVISALAGNIDTVKWEQEEATKAFNEANSVTREYNVQNNTVQAGLDKAKKRVSEMAVELGEKLQPVMTHVISSTTIILKILSTLVTFIKEHSTAIVTTTAAVAAYTLAVNASNIAFKVHYGWLVITQAAQKAFATVLATVKTAWILVQMAMAKVEGNYAKVTLLQTELNTAMKANAIGLIVAGVVALIAVMKTLYDRYKEQQLAQETLNNVKKEAAVQAQEEIDKIKTLHDAAKDETLSMKERQQAVENLNKIIPNYNAQIDATTGKLKESKQALDDYINSLIRQYEVEGAKEQLKKIGQQKAELVGKNQEAQEQINENNRVQQNINAQSSNWYSHGSVAGVTMAGTSQTSTVAENAKLQNDINNNNRLLKNIEKSETALTKMYGSDIQKSVIQETTTNNNTGGGGGGGAGSGTGSGSTTKDKFEAEKKWKEREEALNSIAYAKGEKDYSDYTKRIDEIAIQFYEKELSHTELSADERLQIEGQKAEEQIKQNEKNGKKNIEEENQRYEEELSSLKQKYVDGKLSTDEYNAALEISEMEHLKRMVQVTEEGSKERADAEKAYLDKAFANQKRKQEETLRNEKKFQDAIKKVQDEVFGMTPVESQNAYDEEITKLNLAYAAAMKAAEGNANAKEQIDKAYYKRKKALIKQYNQEELRENQNFMENLNDDIINWLNSEGGQAVMQTAQVLVDGMSSIFSQLTSIIQAEMELETSAIEKKYENEESLAEGNNYKIAKLEKQKEEEVAKVKNEANKKMYNMEVIQAIAQTAISAVNAYSSAAAIPLVGYILAPIAAATAVAAGMLQVASIKKQQQAAEAQGYAEGGYTPDGDKYKTVGVVHAGEWVASQKLLRNPETAAIIQSLDYAQRTNTMGSISAAQVNEDISSNVAVARSSGTTSTSSRENLAKTLRDLNDRLNEPFVTVNTVTGDAGINKAQSDYERMINNKKPKQR